MDVSKTFQEFLSNIKVSNKDEISRRYKKITKILNRKYWDNDSEIYNSLQVGSYGRGTAIDGISDLDMVFELPWSVYSRFNKYEGNGQSALLQEIKNTLKITFSKTDIKGDGQVVVISFENYVVEVLPAFKHNDGTYLHPDSNDNGSWETTKPRSEIDEMNTANSNSHGNLKNLCKMMRSWKNQVGAPMGGLLIDTLCYRFLENSPKYKNKGFSIYDSYVKDFFKYLSEINKDQKYWFAPGSNQKIYKKGEFLVKAKKAYKKCLKAIEKENNKTVNGIWREIFGKTFPAPEKQLSEALRTQVSFKDTEEYIEDMYNVDIRYSLSIDCEVSQQGFRTDLLSALLLKGFGLRVSKKLNFYIEYCRVPEPYIVKWKIRNIGALAEKKDQIRGQIYIDGGHKSRKERTSFQGAHFVECYIIKNNICIARDRIDVPISTT